MLFQLLDHPIEIGIASTKSPCEPVSTALGNPLAVSDHLELTLFTRFNHGFNAEALLNEGHETRDLGFVVLSRRTANDLDRHSLLHILVVGRSRVAQSVLAFRESKALLGSCLFTSDHRGNAEPCVTRILR